MNYIRQLNAFEKWLDENKLTNSAELLMRKILGVGNRRGWPDWVAIENLDLMALMRTKREATVIVWRDELIESGLISYKKGKKGVPNRYKITLLYELNTTVNDAQSEAESVVNSVVETVVESVANSVAETADYSKHKHKPKKKEGHVFAVPTVDEVSAYCRERGNSVDAEAFVAFYSSKGWKVGNNPLRDWKSAIITWEKRDKPKEPRRILT